MAKASRARHHGRTFCKRCCNKIAAGMVFCNAKCRAAYDAGNERPPKNAGVTNNDAATDAAH